MESLKRREVNIIRAWPDKIQVQIKKKNANHKDTSKEETIKPDKVEYQRWGEGRHKDDWNLGIGQNEVFGKDCLWADEEEEQANEAPF